MYSMGFFLIQHTQIESPIRVSQTLPWQQVQSSLTTWQLMVGINCPDYCTILLINSRRKHRVVDATQLPYDQLIVLVLFHFSRN